MAHHNLKLDTFFYSDAEMQAKMFEIRKNDRDYRVGDTITLMRWCNLNQALMGEQLEREITYITDYGQTSPYVVLGLKEI